MTEGKRKRMKVKRGKKKKFFPGTPIVTKLNECEIQTLHKLLIYFFPVENLCFDLKNKSRGKVKVVQRILFVMIMSLRF